jgi:hypothetical protein
MIFSYMDIHPTDAVQVIGHLLHLSKLALSYLSKGMSLLFKSNEMICNSDRKFSVSVLISVSVSV